MDRQSISKMISFFIAAVWLVNGLLCKILDLVPRHHDIVEAILGSSYSSIITYLIGFAEILMAIWIISKFKSKLNAIAQIVIVLIMNLIEIIYASDLLLWGKTNLLFALLFTVIVYTNEFILKPRIN